MKPRTIYKFLLPCLLLIGSLRAFAADSPPWTPDEKDLPRLAQEVTESKFTVRPPAGYERKTGKGPSDTDIIAWASEERADRTRGYLMFVVVPLPPGEDRDSLEVQLGKLLKGIEARRNAWNRTDYESGKINGTPFVRAYWQGNDKQTGYKMAGFYYLTKYNGYLIGISSQDLRENKDTDLHLAESAALTSTVRR